MRNIYHTPIIVIELRLFSSRHITGMKAPTKIKIHNLSSIFCSLCHPTDEKDHNQ